MTIFLASQHTNPSEDSMNPPPTFARPYQSYKAPINTCPCESACAICGKRTAIVEKV